MTKRMRLLLALFLIFCLGGVLIATQVQAAGRKLKANKANKIDVGNSGQRLNLKSVRDKVKNIISNKSFKSKKIESRASTNLKLKANQLKQLRSKSSLIKTEALKRHSLALEKKKIFKRQLAKIKDKRKEMIVQRIQAKLDQLNNRLVDKLVQASDRMLVIANKLEFRADQFKNQGLDVGQVYSQLADFRINVEKFKNELISQKSKSYIPDINNAKNLGQSVRKTIQLFRANFKSLRQDIFNLRSQLIEIFKLEANLRRLAKSKSIQPTITNSAALEAK